jgi:SAM-dependent methyltransferase
MFRWSWGSPDRATHRDVVFERDGDLIAFGDNAIRSAAVHNVSPAVHFDDLIFAFLYNAVCGRDIDQAARAYFTNGRISAERIKNIATMYYVGQCGVLDRSLKLLDFASGYGCMSRHVQNVLPNTEVVACDIHQAAVDFHREHLKIKAEMSSLEPRLLEASADYDLVAALSFFSHLPKRTFVPWLRKLGEFVKPGGILIFTTHGVDAHRKLIPRVRVDGMVTDRSRFPSSSIFRSITI